MAEQLPVTPGSSEAQILSKSRRFTILVGLPTEVAMIALVWFLFGASLTGVLRTTVLAVFLIAPAAGFLLTYFVLLPAQARSRSEFRRPE